MTTKMVFHGSDIEKICAYYHLNKEDIVKFGANVNPLGLSASVKKEIAENIDLFSSYPDRDYVSLRNTISEYCRIPAEFILPGNGSSELISLLIQERAPKHTLILGPTYSEYSRELSFSGSTQEYYHLQEERNFTLDVDDLCKILEKGYDFLIICNPNNPTGILTERERILRILDRAEKTKTFVLVDECFLEICKNEKEYTVKPFIEKYEHLIILKSFTKLYAIPGVRLGYILAGSEEVIERVNRAGQAWSVSHIAQCAGVAALADNIYKEKVIDTVAEELAYMKKEFYNLPVVLYDGDVVVGGATIIETEIAKRYS